MAALKKWDVLGLLQEHGAILQGHFKLASGLHAPVYIQAALVLQYPHVADKLAKALAAKFPQSVGAVITPGGSAHVLGQALARYKKCRALFAERDGGSMGFRRDFKLDRGERVLIIEDVITTGRITGELVGLASAYGAKVAGVGALVDRSMRPGILLSVPVRTLVSYPLELFPSSSCVQCAAGAPLVDMTKEPSPGRGE